MNPMSEKPRITVETVVQAPAQTVWSCWTEPEHIMQWNNASDDWHTPRATADVREGVADAVNSTIPARCNDERARGYSVAG